MIEFSQLILRLAVALVLGAGMGFERELAKKEAGIGTLLMVAGGAALFSIGALSLPYLIALSPEHLPAVIAGNSGFLNLIANIAVGIGFIGAGIIVKNESHVHGLTTAAVIWFAGAVGVLAGIGMIELATIAAVAVSTLLYILRSLNVAGRIQGPDHVE